MSMNRNDFIRLAASIVGGLGISTISSDFADAMQAEDAADVSLDETYLVKGLTGMANANGWFEAHWGAAVLAGYYLCKENKLNNNTVAAIKAQLDYAIKLRASQFKPLPNEKADKTSIEDVANAVVPAMKGGVRSHGHAVIFGSLSIRALRDAPQMAQPTLVKALCGHSRLIARNKPKKATNSMAYPSTQAMIESLFDNLIRFKGLLGQPSIRRPNFTHMVTHTEALVNLEAMGYESLAKAGHVGHRAHVDEPVPAFDTVSVKQGQIATLEGIMNKAYWQEKDRVAQWRQKPTRPGNPNGHWIAAGHLFKVLCSYHRLANRVKDKEKVRLCSAILLERYFNPSVVGG